MLLLCQNLVAQLQLWRGAAGRFRGLMPPHRAAIRIARGHDRPSGANQFTLTRFRSALTYLVFVQQGLIDDSRNV